MNAIPSQDTSGSETRGRVRRAPVFLAPVLFVMAGQVVVAEEQIEAVLKLREVDFVYRSSAAVLSCSALRGRVASILHALGAREDLEVSANGCDAVVMRYEEPEDTWPRESEPWRTPPDPWETSSDRGEFPSDRFNNRDTRPRQLARVRIRAMMPVEMTPEVLAELKKDKTRRELVSRVRGDATARLDDEPIVFPAQRQTVTLSRRTVGLDAEECELLEQMSKSTFKELDVRVVRRGPSCDRNRVSHIPPELTVEALLPVMPSVPQLSPAAGEEKGDSG